MIYGVFVCPTRRSKPRLERRTPHGGVLFQYVVFVAYVACVALKASPVHQNHARAVDSTTYLLELAAAAVKIGAQVVCSFG